MGEDLEVKAGGDMAWKLPIESNTETEKVKGLYLGS